MNDEKPVELISVDAIRERIAKLEQEKAQFRQDAEATLQGYDMAIMALNQLIEKPAN